MSILKAFTLVHVAISLIGILGGFVIAIGFVAGKRTEGWTKIFLIFTALTSVTGFFFPFHGFTPADALGITSLVVLAIAIYAVYARNLAGPWRWIYVLMAMFAFWMNFFVLIAQSFQKVPALHSLAPTQSSPLFGATQLAVLVVFIVWTVVGVRKFHPTAGR